MFRVMMLWTSLSSSVSLARFRCVRVSIYSFFVFWMNVSVQYSQGISHTTNALQKHASLTKLDESIWARGRINLCPVQSSKLAAELLEELEGQLLGVSLVRESQEEYARLYHIVECVPVVR